MSSPHGQYSVIVSWNAGPWLSYCTSDHQGARVVTYFTLEGIPVSVTAITGAYTWRCVQSISIISITQ